jgi:hypothetical protein
LGIPRFQAWEEVKSDYSHLIDELREVCEEYEADLDDWEIEDALDVVETEYQ